MPTQSTSDLQCLLPHGWQRARGFSYGLTGPGRDLLCIAGQLAVENGAAAPAAGMSFAEQFRQCLKNVVVVTESAGGTSADIASLRIFVTSIAGFKRSQAEIATSWRDIFGKHFPAMTLVEVTALFEETALIEIEAIALLKKETAV